MFCDHCKTARRRKATFVIKKEDQYRQVGKSCLKDFTGHPSPDQYAAYAEMIHDIDASLSELEDDDFCGGSMRQQSRFRTLEILGVAGAFVKAYGFVGKSDADSTREPTSHKVSQYFFPPIQKSDNNEVAEIVASIDIDRAKLCQSWLLGEAAKRQGDEFFQNIGVYASAEFNEASSFGYLAAAAMLYEKEQGLVNTRAKLAEGVVDAPLSSTGAKVSIDAEVISAARYERASYHYYDSGLSQILVLKTEDGKLIKMFTSNLEIKKGMFVKLSGKIGKSEKETYEKSPFKGLTITMMAPRARLCVIGDVCPWHSSPAEQS